MTIPELKEYIISKIKPNGSKAITGQTLQDTLVQMADTLDDGYVVQGFTMADVYDLVEQGEWAQKFIRENGIYDAVGAHRAILISAASGGGPGYIEVSAASIDSISQAVSLYIVTAANKRYRVKYYYADGYITAEELVRTINGLPIEGLNGDVLAKNNVLSATSYQGATLEIGTGVTEVQTEVLDGVEFKLVGDSLTAGTTIDNEWVLRIYATTFISSVSFTPLTGRILWANGQAPLFVAGRRYELSFKRTYDGVTLGVWCEFY